MNVICRICELLTSPNHPSVFHKSSRSWPPNVRFPLPGLYFPDGQQRPDWLDRVTGFDELFAPDTAFGTRMRQELLRGLLFGAGLLTVLVLIVLTAVVLLTDLPVTVIVLIYLALVIVSWHILMALRCSKSIKKYGVKTHVRTEDFQFFLTCLVVLLPTEITETPSQRPLSMTRSMKESMIWSTKPVAKPNTFLSRGWLGCLRGHAHPGSTSSTLDGGTLGPPILADCRCLACLFHILWHLQREARDTGQSGQCGFGVVLSRNAAPADTIWVLSFLFLRKAGLLKMKQIEELLSTWLLSIFVHFCPFLSIFVHFCWSKRPTAAKVRDLQRWCIAVYPKEPSPWGASLVYECLGRPTQWCPEYGLEIIGTMFKWEETCIIISRYYTVQSCSVSKCILISPPNFLLFLRIPSIPEALPRCLCLYQRALDFCRIWDAEVCLLSSAGHG